MSTPRDRSLEGLCLRCGPLGENDRLLTLLSADEGLIRLAASGARRPRSSLGAAGPLTHLRAQVQQGNGLGRLRQVTVLRCYTRLGQQLDTLAAAQWLLELTQLLVPEGQSLPGLLPLLLHRLGQLEDLLELEPLVLRQEALALAVQGGVQLLGIGGFGLPLHTELPSGAALLPPVGDWSWRCSLLPAEGFYANRHPGAVLLLNASEMALLQRLSRPQLPRKATGELMGPTPVWERLLDLLGFWCREHLGRSPRSLALLRQDSPAAAMRKTG